MLNRSAAPVAALFLATFLWGSSFLTISKTLAHTDALTLVTLRFGAAAVLVALIGGRGTWRDLDAPTLRAGAICGVAIFLCYLANTAGLATVPSAVSGFLTALYVPITPFLAWAVTRRRPPGRLVAGALLAFCGLVVIADPFGGAGPSLGIGEALTVLSAFLSALDILLVGRYAGRCRNAKSLALAQLLTVAALAGVTLGLTRAAGYRPPVPTDWSWELFAGVAWLAVIVGCVQMLLSWAQRYVPAGRAAVIFAMEAVFAAFIGLAAGEDVAASTWAGGALIVGGILVSEWLKGRQQGEDSHAT